MANRIFAFVSLIVIVSNCIGCSAMVSVHPWSMFAFSLSAHCAAHTHCCTTWAHCHLNYRLKCNSSPIPIRLKHQLKVQRVSTTLPKNISDSIIVFIFRLRFLSTNNTPPNTRFAMLVFEPAMRIFEPCELNKSCFLFVLSIMLFHCIELWAAMNVVSRPRFEQRES